MPLVGVNNEPLLERAIFGYDGTDYRIVKVDTDGNLVAALKASQIIEVIQDTAADLKATVTIPTGQDIEARNHGYFAAAWQKNAIPLNYYGTVDEDLGTIATGTNVTVNSTAVPANTVYVVDAASILNNTRAGTNGIVNVMKSSGTIIRKQAKATFAQNEPILLETAVVLSAGDKIRFSLSSTQVGDVILGGMTGYYFETDL